MTNSLELPEWQVMYNTQLLILELPEWQVMYNTQLLILYLLKELWNGIKRF